MTKLVILIALLAATSALAQTPIPPSPTPTLLPWPSGVPTPTPGGPVPTPIFLQSIDISPQNATIKVGESVLLTATGVWGNGRRHELQGAWSSDNGAVAEVQDVDSNWIGQGGSFRNGGPAGTVNGINAGTATISIRFGNITGSAQVKVTQ